MNTYSSLWLAYIKISFVIALYWFVSISMIFINNHILSDLNLDVPFFVTWFQCLVTLMITLCGTIFSTILSFLKLTDYKLCIHFNLTTIWQVLPLSLVFAGMITFNNLSLKTVGVSFYTVGRSLTIVFNVVLSYCVLGTITSFKAILCCGAIIGGFILGVVQEEQNGAIINTSILFCICASLCVSLNSILTVRTMSAVSSSIWQLTFYLNLIATFLFTPLVLLSGEANVLLTNVDSIQRTTFWLLLVLSGVFGFLMGYVTNLQITFTSPLTHNISGTAKAAAQTVMATYLFQEQKTFNWWLSNVVVLIASAIYTRVKQVEMQKTHFKRMEQDVKNQMP